ncbi:MAG: nicotinate-nucleotide adenylyltransferase [Longimicrobiales bacterium]
MRLGIFGGTFDPPHIGHLIVAQDAALALGLDRVFFVPAGAPPHKRERSITSAAIRRAMLEGAVAGNARFAVEPLELEQGLSYTVDTLRSLRARHPAAEMWLLIGLDQWREFATWRDPDAILALAGVAVIQRGADSFAPESAAPVGATPNAAPERMETSRWSAVYGDRVRFIAATRIDISSSEIRRRVGVGESVRYLAPDAVIEIIFREQLYR